MKAANYLLTVLMAGMLALVGCGKPKKPSRLPVVGVWDMAPVREAFPAPSAEVKDSLNKVIIATPLPPTRARPRRTGQAGPNLPDLTEAQKKAVNAKLEQLTKIEQLKQGMNGAVARPPQ